MKSKICNKCKKEKDLNLFVKRKSSEDGFWYYCKECHNKHNTKWRKNNTEKDKISKTKYRRKIGIEPRSENGNTFCVLLGFKYCEGENGCHKIKSLAQFHKRKDSNDGFRGQCKECVCKFFQKYMPNYKKNEASLEYNLANALRNRLRKVIRYNRKVGSAVRDLGCSVEELKKHLEKQFYSHPQTGEQMAWDNWSYEGWHIDHIKPLASFDLTDREQFLKACHYTNLQPLWAEENMKKGAKINA